VVSPGKRHGTLTHGPRAAFNRIDSYPLSVHISASRRPYVDGPESGILTG